MSWLNRAKRGIKTWRKKNLPDGLWEKCPSCGEILYSKELIRSLSVCSKCDYHFRIGSSDYLGLLTDERSFVETERGLYSADPLDFKDSKEYKTRIAEAIRRTGMNSAILTGTAMLDGMHVAVGILDFNFLGGSMGSVVGEKIARLAGLAVEKRIPLILVSASGGARMQESILSLMQMAKTSAAVAKLSREGLPYISILTNPTTGGVAASFAFQGDIIIAEPKALVGFAGPRVIRETVGEELPEGFQRSEFLLEHGMIDMIVSRRDLKQKIGFMLDTLMCGAAASVEEKSRKHDRKNISLIR
ncbi:MAG TPA: acetyl-CoA carboxylase carboxyltransferase subunit beta [Candidatus Eisenbacteria bacterium]|uniref:Acetyl-coenzyme A carboxylase carboxyl transferase subunit beta n=1 Tax=Eiseniibacteriota bacterium TaxID=2212470 RepID=A0A7V2F3F7_UNCEI|nr:acetyl-CoA carboxylase carboxyltransferase subunit beta [Candidatus Eisenbacteria bacterium]